MSREKVIEIMARGVCLQAHILKFGADAWREGELDVKVDGYWAHFTKHAKQALTALEAAGYVIVPKSQVEL